MGEGMCIEEYRRDGFAVLRNVLPPGTVEDLLEQFRTVFRRQFRHHRIDEGRTGSFDGALAALFRAYMVSYLAAAKLTQYLPVLHRLGADPMILDLVRRFGVTAPALSTRPVVHIVSDDLKVPGGYHRTPPHQDWRSVQGSLDALVVWLPLVEVDAGFGPLELLPGSHRRGLLDAVADPFGTRVAPGVIDENAFVPIPANPGDAIVFSMFTAHRTGTARRSGVRWSVSFRYNNMDEPSFIARGYPNPYLYKPRDDLLYPGFPIPDDLDRIFGKTPEE